MMSNTQRLQAPAQKLCDLPTPVCVCQANSEGVIVSFCVYTEGRRYVFAVLSRAV